ncbi:MAG: DUF2752 domain-containing protein [Chitinophagaceae bacterium]
MEKYFLPCAYKSLLGFDCPTCGFQRSALHLFRGEFKESFLMYPPLILCIILILIFGAYLVNKRWIGKKLLMNYATFVLFIVGGNYLYKMLF